MFVAFEGIDGSGKTTVSNQVAERLRAAGLSVKHLRAEGRFVSAVAEAIRDLGRDSRNLALTPEAEFLLYVARDVQLIEEALRPELGQYDIVLADRFLFTAQVLAEHGRRLSREFTEPVLRAAARGLSPDLVLLVDVDPVLARARRKAYKLSVADKRPPSRKGLSGVGLQHRVRRGYLALAESDPERWLVLENEAALEQTVARATELIRTAKAQGARSAIAQDRARNTRAPVTATPIGSTQQALTAFLAWIDRRIEPEPRVAAYVLGGLFGAAVDGRRRSLAERVPEAMLAALSGRVDDVSWEIRSSLRPTHAAAVAQTLSGIPNTDARASSWRNELAEIAPQQVLLTLTRQDDEQTWTLRERFFEDFPELVVGSLSGLDSERAWSLRERWLKRRGEELQSSYEVARVACKSITHLSCERAWKIRKQARVVAPVIALASLGSARDAESYRWRREALRRAPKVVMATLKNLSDEAAWELRAAVVTECKEVIDSVQNLDDPAAWQLREQAQDLWPSTVVKSLGVLADGERGAALLRRQLERHPTNVSLLKHAAAVALGVHRVDTFEE